MQDLGFFEHIPFKWGPVFKKWKQFFFDFIEPYFFLLLDTL